MGGVELTIIIVNYNTRDLVLECLRSLYQQTRGLDFEVLLVDNASRDGSAEAVAGAFPRVRVLALAENRGFGGANNLAAREARGAYLLLLNPDTVVLDGAVQELLAFARQNPRAGIWGGRTLFENRALNPTSCWARSTPWSMFCRAAGLATVFHHTRLFDPESYGRWQRDTVREVDIVTGCFLVIARRVWDQLGGFDPAFFMYGEEADLCLRARRLGYRPLVCPGAEIIHHAGRSPSLPSDRLVQKLTSRRLLVERHWPRRWVAFGKAMQLVWIGRRWLQWSALRALGLPAARERAHTFGEVWRRRREWVGARQAGPRPA